MLRERKWECANCGHDVVSYGRDTECEQCGQPYNAFGQQLRRGWQDNPSYWDEEVSDLDGYEIGMARRYED